MTRRHSFALICVMLAPLSGCISFGDYYTVPWWKGAPATLISPTSLEAMAWKDQHRARHQHPVVDDPYFVGELPPEHSEAATELR